MNRFGTEAERRALQDRVHLVYGNWAPNHADGKLLTTHDYEPDNPYHQADRARFPLNFNPELGRRLGLAAMGETGYKVLSDGFAAHNVVERGLYRAKQRQSTIVTTLHLLNVLDTPMTQQNLLDSSGGNEELAEINDLIASPMLARIDIAGMESMEVMSASGPIDLALPKDGAASYGMLPQDISALDRFYSGNLNRRLREGVFVHWSLPGTRGLKVLTKEGRGAWVVNRVADEIANILRSKEMLAVPTPMHVVLGKTDSQVLPPRNIKSVGDVHHMMAEMTELASGMVGRPVYYGVPEGAKIISEFDATE